MNAENTEEKKAPRPAGRRGRSSRHVVFVGPAEEIGTVLARLLDSASVVVDGVFSGDAAWRMPEGVALLGEPSGILTYLEGGAQVDDVYFSMGALEGRDTLLLYGLCQRHGVRCLALPPCVSSLGRRMQVAHQGNTVVLSLRPEPLSRWYNRALKRTLDLLLSLLFLLTLFPLVYVVMAVLTKWKSPGPIFRVHKRCGMDGRTVRCLTFRRETLQLVDRMPLVLGVFGGSLSMVGPRPLHPLGREAWLGEVNRYVARYPVKPGLTGLAQQEGLGDETADEARLQQRAQADAWYMEHWSIWLDLRLLLSAPFRVAPRVRT